MGEEIDRMIESKRRAIFFFVLLLISIAIIIVALVVMGSGDYSGSNDEFAHIKAYGEVQTRRYDISDSDALLFFFDEHKEERTLFLEAIPNLKIVNSDKYYVEVTTNKDLFDILEVGSSEKMLSFDFKSECYNHVTEAKSSYEKGLYVECSAFDVTVYAPVSQVFTSAEIVLDYQAPKAELIRIYVIGELQESRVYDIDAEYLNCLVCGETDLTISGNVSKEAAISAYHNSKVDAESLNVPLAYTYATSQLFGYSSISGNGYSDSSFISLGYALTWFLVLLPLALAGVFTLFFVKFIKRKRSIDAFIARVEAEGNFVVDEFFAPKQNQNKENEPTEEADGDDDKNSEKTEKSEENLLQNEE